MYLNLLENCNTENLRPYIRKDTKVPSFIDIRYKKNNEEKSKRMSKGPFSHQLIFIEGQESKFFILFSFLSYETIFFSYLILCLQIFLFLRFRLVVGYGSEFWIHFFMWLHLISRKGKSARFPSIFVELLSKNLVKIKQKIGRT